MAYSDVSLLASDSDFMQRTRACVSIEGEPEPVEWSNDHQWEMAATPGFGEKYTYAILTGNPRPGWDESVISDPDILSAVQTIRNTVTPQ